MDIYSQPLFPTLLSNHFSPSRTRHLRHREDDDNNDTILYLIRRRHEARRRTAMFQFASLTLFHATSPSVHPLSLATSCPRWISLKVPQQKDSYCFRYPCNSKTTQKSVVCVYLFLYETITAIRGRFVWGFVN